ncbi:uncharacterized protein LOC126819670 isoform X4 [Patella vulgata]|uniref:uncharacterized protein LOC126819670 isoform X4 n=1 Tax=Patella vulgata TaxID=6465 RepID=UPI00218089B9|nr:uncharacterized protein LOC126819670 isoform X4 [Patella vulgata]
MTDNSKEKSEWSTVNQDARILYSSLFYSQGPVDGYLIGEKARDFFLPSGLHLPVLSQIWNLADMSNDNLLTVEEFILTMHFCHGALQGKKLPRSLTPSLRPPDKTPIALPFLTEEEKLIFSKIFEAIDVDRTGFIEGSTAREIFQQTGLTSDQLALVWDLADINRDGRLDYGEWTVACQLIKLAKLGQSLEVPINVFTNLPDRIAPGSLQAGKKRVAEYEEKKQKLMSLKERRRIQAEREKKRLELTQEKIQLITQLYDVLEKAGNSHLPELQQRLTQDRDYIEKQEEIVFRLKKEHERVRQDTVKIILGEQKVSNDVRQIKEQTDELYKNLRSSHSKATKDPDPFHQLFEERKGNKHAEHVETDLFSPFCVNVFSKSFLKKLPPKGKDIFNEQNHRKMSDLLNNCKDVNTEFLKSLDQNLNNVNNTDALEEDQIFKSIPGSTDDKSWLGLTCELQPNDQHMSELLQKLQDLKTEFIKLNNEGGQLVFKNPDDYLSRKLAREEEEKQEKFRQHRRASDKRSLSSTPDSLKRRSVNSTPEIYKRRQDTSDGHKRRSYIERNDEATQAAREYRLKRRSLHSEHSSDKVEGLPNSSYVNKKQEPKARSSELLTSKTTNKPKDKTQDKSLKKSPAPLPPSSSHPSIHSSSQITHTQTTHNPELTLEPKLNERANSEPILDKADSASSIGTNLIHKETISKSSLSPTGTRSSASFSDDSLPTSPTDKSPTKPSVKKTRAPAPPVELAQNLTNRADHSPSALHDSHFPSTRTTEPSFVKEQRTVESRSMSVYGPTSPVASISPDSLSPTNTPDLSPLRSNSSHQFDKDNFSDYKTQQMFEQTAMKAKSTLQTVPLSPDSLSPPTLSPTSTVSPPLSPIKPPERPPRTKKRKSSTKSPSSPAIPMNGDLVTDKVEEKNEKNEKNESILSAPDNNLEALFDKMETILVNGDKPKAERPSSLFSESKTNNENIMELNNAEQSKMTADDSEVNRDENMDNQQRPSIKKRAAPEPPAPKSESSFEDNKDLSWESPPKTDSCVPVVTIKKETKHIENDERSTELINRNGTGLRAKPAFDRMSISSYDSADSVPPPLPNSAPPPLPGSCQPTSDEATSPDEIVEIEYTVPLNTAPIDSDLDESFNRENHIAASRFEDPEGDSGIMTSVPTSSDETDGNSHGPVRILSYNLTSSQLDNPLIDNSMDSQYDDSSLTSPLVFESKRSLFEEKKDRSSAQAMSPTSPTSTTSSDGMMSPRYRKYNGQELVDKARQFADMVQKPNFTVKTKGSDSDEFNQETLQEFELNRRSVISQSTVRKKDVRSPTEPDQKLFEEAEELPIQNTEKSPVKHWEVNTEPVKNRVPDIGWNNSSGERNNLFSQNIVQENESTDSVNRQSLSDSLHNTKRQWEGVFKDHIDNQYKDPKEKPKSSVRHWEVKLPNQVIPRGTIRQQEDLTSSPNKMADTESAIDREIRLANEREDLLRREKEERLKLEQQNGKLDISSFENAANSPPSNKPLYHEMTEADRGSEMWQRESLIQQELREQEEREVALKRKNLTPVKANQDSDNSEDQPYESIIQREIRLQREREEELERQRIKKQPVVVVEEDPVPSPPAASPVPQTNNNNNNNVQSDINHNEQKVNISYEDAISGFQHDGESRIAREMRELREREEEIRKQRELLQNNNNKQSLPNNQTPPKSASSQSITKSSSSTSINTTKQGTWQKEVSPYIQNHKRSDSVDSLASSQSTGRTTSDYTPSRDVKVMPNIQQDSDEESTPRYAPTSETPIQREIRLARERENELRRSKGLPEIEAPVEPTPLKKKPPTNTQNTPTSNYTPSPRSRQDSSGQAVRSYASSRLQQELSTQKQRELLYRQEGKIITTSEEHIEPMKYTEVTGSDQIDGSVKRNFKRSSISSNNIPSPETPPAEEPQIQPSPVKPIKGGGGASFSYKESRQTAESKIERELREMREREQELRIRRDPNSIEEEPESPTDTTFAKSATVGPDGQKRSLADRWQQVCQS